MKTLYLLTEDDSDSLFYEACAEKITGEGFTATYRRMRKGSGIGAVRASLRIALAEVGRMADGSGAHFLVAMDNDRAPHATAADALPADQRVRLSKSDLRKSDRNAELLAALDMLLGNNRSKWPIPVAVAIPVEMVESWLLLIARGGRGHDLPRFARQDSHGARQFHRPAAPPLQLKDRRDSVLTEDGFHDRRDEWLMDLVFVRLDPTDLAMRSPSFALFKQWLDSWPKTLARN